MQFFVTPAGGPTPEAPFPFVHLRRAPWDDYWEFDTTFDATVYVRTDKRVHLGEVKIGEFGLVAGGKSTEPGSRGVRWPTLPSVFDEIPDSAFSLGQSSSYYTRLTDLGPSFRESYLKAIGDIAWDQQGRRAALRERVTQRSLLRYVPLGTLETQFARLARGGSELTPYHFTFSQGINSRRRKSGYFVDFYVKPNSNPPSNIHVIIGRNGVGKSTLLHEMAQAAIDGDNPVGGSMEDGAGGRMHFPNVVWVSFSAFDEFEPLSVPRDRTKSLVAHYVGLKKVGSKERKADEATKAELTLATKDCMAGERLVRFRRAVELLEADPIFAELGLTERLRTASSRQDLEDQISVLYGRLSSGHKIVLLAILKLVQTVSEKTLVLIDEPEAHLHPPLLSAYVRALSDLMISTNGVAILTTHSPVVLQEVPSSCVWVLSRAGWQVAQARPEVETFAESVGLLTGEVFGLEVDGTGFHRELIDAVGELGSYDEIMERFSNRVGREGRILVRNALMVAQRGSADVAL